jgi:hypothetical protein
MSSFPGSPKLLKGGLILLDPVSGATQRIISLQYNPETLTRTLAPLAVAGEATDRSEALRLKGPPIETIKLDAELDATDQLEFPDQDQAAVQVGILPQLAALETIIYPASDTLQLNHVLAQVGTLEVAPTLGPLTLFVWSRSRVVPVRITDFSITEQAFDPNLNPILAKVSIGLRVLNVQDLGFDGKGGSLYMIYHQQKERLAQQAAPATLTSFGLTSLT